MDALAVVKQRSASTPRWRLLLGLLRRRQIERNEQAALERLNLQAPKTQQARVARALVLDALRY